MISLDDNISEEYNLKPKYIKKHKRGRFDTTELLNTILYNNQSKQFIIGSGKVSKNTAFLGWYINYDDTTDVVDVLYRGFLYKDYLKLPVTLQTRHLQLFIYSQFKIAADSIKSYMPKIKKLKRINLKMITYKQALFVYNNLDALIERYEDIYGYENAMYFKAQLTTSPFYVNDNGLIKIFDMQTAEFKLPELESEAYFLAYFSFLNKV